MLRKMRENKKEQKMQWMENSYNCDGLTQLCPYHINVNISYTAI